MTVMADSALWFQCEECGHGQYTAYSLELRYEYEECIFVDYIDCEKCKHTNRVIDPIPTRYGVGGGD